MPYVITLTVTLFVVFMLILTYGLCVIAQRADDQIDEEEQWIRDHPDEYQRIVDDLNAARDREARER